MKTKTCRLMPVLLAALIVIGQGCATSNPNPSRPPDTAERFNLSALAEDTARIVAGATLTKPGQTPAQIQARRVRIAKLIGELELLAGATNASDSDLWALLDPAISQLDWEERWKVESGRLFFRRAIGDPGINVQAPEEVRKAAASVARGLRSGAGALPPGPPEIPKKARGAGRDPEGPGPRAVIVSASAQINTR